MFSIHFCSRLLSGDPVSSSVFGVRLALSSLSTFQCQHKRGGAYVDLIFAKSARITNANDQNAVCDPKPGSQVTLMTTGSFKKRVLKL